MKRILLLTGVLLTIGTASLAQWGPRGCSPGLQLQPFVQPVFAVPVAQTEQIPMSDWRYNPNDRTSAYLYKNGVQIGGYSYSGGYWRDYDSKSDTWGEKVYCTREDVPQHIGKKSPPLTGLDWDKIGNRSKVELHTKSGSAEITRQEAIERLLPIEAGKDDIPDDSKKFRLTVIGKPEERKPVIEAWAQVEPELRNRVVTWSVSPDHHSLRESDSGTPKFKLDGKPGVYFTASDGQVIHRQDDFKGPEDFHAIRKGVKIYDQDKDLDLRKPKPAPNPLGPNAPSLPFHPAMLAALLLGGLVILTQLKGRKQ